MSVDVPAILAAIGLVGESKFYPGPPTLVKEHSYIGNSWVAFKCSIYVDSDMLGQGMHNNLPLGLVLPITAQALGENDTSIEVYRDFSTTLEFDFGISRQDRHASAVWLSAYVGNYIANCLSYLNDFLERYPIKGEENGIGTNLDVKWGRVAGTF